MTASEPAISQDFINFMDNDQVQAWGVHDCSDKAFYVNRHSAWLFGIPRSFRVCGKPFSEIPAPIFRNCSEKIIEQNHICIQQKKEIAVLNVHPGGNGWFAYISKKSPHYNLKGEVDGVLSYGYSVTQAWMKAANNIRSLMKVDDRTLKGQAAFQVVGSFPCLSPRESEVLFFLICNQQIKQIASILELSENTIRTHIEHLKKKFSVHSIAQLLEAAIASGCQDFLPATLRLRQLSKIVSHN
ncbi:MAG: LuxR C-terminal-related transcriptional regulator [Endozoicomonas sp.]